MPTVAESVCCRELDPVKAMTDAYEEAIECITQHPGFHSVCLDRWVLNTAYLDYKQHCGWRRQEGTQDQKYRHTAYRQLPHWCWGYSVKSATTCLRCQQHQTNISLGRWPLQRFQ